MNNKKQAIQVNMPPVVAACIDGHQLAINNATGDTNMLFIQLQPRLDNDAIQQGVVVANIRLNIDQLRQLNDNISKTIEGYDKKHSES